MAIGVLSALPVINLANCCCAWILFGGALAAYLMQQNHPEPIQIGDGAIVGLLAGLVGAFVWLIVSIPISMVMAPFQSRDDRSACCSNAAEHGAGAARAAREHVRAARRSASACCSASS